MRRIFDITTQPEKVKKPATAKQRRALMKARGIRTQKMLNKMYAEAQQRYIGEDPIISRRKYINRVRALAKRDNITIQQAQFELMHTTPYISKADNYKYQIQKYVQANPTQRAYLRKLVAEALGQNYTETSVNWDLFQYDPGSEAITNNFNNTIISLRIVEGANSEDPNFVEIIKS